MSESEAEAGSTQRDYSWAIPLIKAMERGDWTSFKRQFDDHPRAETDTKINSREETFLHLATETGNVHFVRELVKLMSPEELEVENIYGDQALISAATGGIKEIAEIMLAKNSKLAGIPNQHGLLPVVIAAKNGNKDMAQYLCSKTRFEELPNTTENGDGTGIAAINGARLVIATIISDMYDITMLLLRKNPKLTVACDSHKRNAVTVLAQRPSAFPSGCRHGFWEGILYKGIRLLSGSKYLERPVDCHRDGITARINTINLVLCRLREFIWTTMKHISVPGFRIKELHDKQLLHVKALQVLQVITAQLSSLNEYKLQEAQAYTAVLRASEFGIIEMVSELIKCNPDLQFSRDGQGRDIFQMAVLHRQEKVFNLIYEMRNRKIITVRGDKFDNNLLHAAGSVTPSCQLDKISGAALQMQCELQWFKEVERLLPARFKDERNKSKKTPRELFTENHKIMVKAGEGWMKATATSCMVIAALIATVTFTAAFTVPGGNFSDTGIPIHIGSAEFISFLVTDALSLLSSLTSMLIFLAILTARYAEEDFLFSLPNKLIIGLATLFFSVATMIVAFCASLFVLVQGRAIWVPILSTSIATVPVILFIKLQFPLLVDMLGATYGPSIFDKKNEGVQMFGSSHTASEVPVEIYSIVYLNLFINV